MAVWIEVCRRDLQNLTLSKTKIAHFATLFKTTDLFYDPDPLYSFKGFRSKNTPSQRRQIVKLQTLFKTQNPENHTLFSGTYPSGPNKGVPPPPSPGDTGPGKEVVLSGQPTIHNY